jgi:hypothetical protein
MNFPPGTNPTPGYYNITGAFIFNPQPIEQLIDDNTQDLGLYLKNAGFNDKELENYLPFPNNLTDIICDNNLFTHLPNLPNSLTWLNCNFNQIEELPNLPNILVNLDCNNNKLKRLPTLQNTNLEMLNCSRNLLTEIPELPNSIVRLDCGNNQLTTLPELPNSLNNLFCRGNDFDNNTIDRIIQFYRNAIQQGFPNNAFPPFQMELDYFIQKKNLKTNQSVSVIHSLTKGRMEELEKKPMPRVMIKNINEYANLRNDFNTFGGRRNKKKSSKKKSKSNKKTKTTKKTKKRRMRMSKKSKK